MLGPQDYTVKPCSSQHDIYESLLDRRGHRSMPSGPPHQIDLVDGARMNRLQAASPWMQPQARVVWIGIQQSHSFEEGIPWVRVASPYTRRSALLGIDQGQGCRHGPPGRRIPTRHSASAGQRWSRSPQSAVRPVGIGGLHGDRGVLHAGVLTALQAHVGLGAEGDRATGHPKSERSACSSGALSPDPPTACGPTPPGPRPRRDSPGTRPPPPAAPCRRSWGWRGGRRGP